MKASVWLRRPDSGYRDAAGRRRRDAISSWFNLQRTRLTKASTLHHRHSRD
ncbi:MAG: hypothetical protein WKG07_31405 [Hymenobacter sp.]